MYQVERYKTNNIKTLLIRSELEQTWQRFKDFPCLSSDCAKTAKKQGKCRD